MAESQILGEWVMRRGDRLPMLSVVVENDAIPPVPVDLTGATAWLQLRCEDASDPLTLPEIPGTPAVPGYLDPNFGIVTTPDPGPLPAPCTFVFKVRGPSNAYGVVVGQWPGAPNQAWNLALAPGDNVLYFMTSADGSTVTYDYTPTADPTGADQLRAMSVDIGHPSIEWAASASGTWQQVASGLGAPVVPFDTAAAMGIGNTFGGRIYSVELRTGLDPAAGTVLWRFDASDYPGTGTSYVDPRGRTWTLTNAAAITPVVPATLPPAPHTLVNGWLVLPAYVYNAPAGVVVYDWPDFESAGLTVGIDEMVIRVDFPDGTHLTAPSDRSARLVVRPAVLPPVLS